jgi:hypothetical protein
MTEQGETSSAARSLQKPASRVPPPAAWLQRLVNDKKNMGKRTLSPLMAASWDMCEAVLRVMDQRRLFIKVSTSKLLPIALMQSHKPYHILTQSTMSSLHLLAAERQLPGQPAGLVAQSVDNGCCREAGTWQGTRQERSVLPRTHSSLASPALVKNSWVSIV